MKFYNIFVHLEVMLSLCYNKNENIMYTKCLISTQNCFVTERILKELNLAELSLKTRMDIEEYNACKMFFEKDTLRGW